MKNKFIIKYILANNSRNYKKSIFLKLFLSILILSDKIIMNLSYKD